jgi:Protein of unknown function (DUF3277).
MKFYSFKETTLILDGIEVTGFDESDDSIVMRRLEDSMGHQIGNKGEMAVWMRASRAGEIVFKLMQTSSDNSRLSIAMSAAENGLFVPIAVMYKDNLGGDLITGNRGYLRKPADVQRGTATGSQAWSIVVERMDFLLQGGQDV